MGYDYEIAKTVLSEPEKNRILCLYLNCDMKAFNGIVDWDAATTAFGSASVESMKVSLKNGMRKIEKAGGVSGVDASPEKTPAAGGRKRKAKTDGEDGGIKPKKGRGRKKKDEVQADADDEEAVAGGVKKEEGDDLE